MPILISNVKHWKQLKYLIRNRVMLIFFFFSFQILQNDKLELLKPGSLQHLGENLLPFLLQTAAAPDESKAVKEGESTGRSDATYFDRLVHLGENMFGFFVQIARSSHLLKATAVEEKTKADQSSPVYFDILVHHIASMSTHF